MKLKVLEIRKDCKERCISCKFSEAYMPLGAREETEKVRNYYDEQKWQKEIYKESPITFILCRRFPQKSFYCLKNTEDDDNKELTYYSNHQEVDPNEWCGEYKSKPNYYKNVKILNK